MKSFIIRQPKWIRNYYLLIFCAAIIFVGVFTTLRLNDVLKTNVYLTLTVLSSVFAIFGFFGICFYFYEKFYYKDGVYCCVRPFRKAQKAKLSDISYVNVKTSKKRFCDVEIEFVGKSGENLIVFTADGWIFKNNILITNLKQNRIKINNYVAEKS